MYKYKIFNNIADDGIDILKGHNFIEDNTNPEIILLRSKVLSDNDLNDSLYCIGRAGAGTNNIPAAEATKKGIVVFNTPGANANAVKELVICGLLLSSRGIIQGNNFSKTLDGLDADALNAAMEEQKKIFKGTELKGKTLGIVGLGAIGSLVAQTAQSLGMNLIGFDPHISVDSAWRLPKEVEKAESLEALLSMSDYISLHVPLVEATKGLICLDKLKYCKKGAKIINLSRGGIVNNNDIISALDQEIVSRFVTDFPTPELISRSNSTQDVILLPHLGASTKEAEINCALMACDQVSNFLMHGTIVNSINFPPIRLGRTTPYRLVIINRNEPGMIGKIADEIAGANINIADMTNKSRDEIAINLIDVDEEPSENLLAKLQDIDHVLSVRTCS
jgi:D-3-phosphoglycerate dehydrogenase|tara:strand:- start:309 stop:1484 length:1176 start_codon:yes stop_codon:yes gene_type:complete